MTPTLLPSPSLVPGLALTLAAILPLAAGGDDVGSQLQPNAGETLRGEATAEAASEPPSESAATALRVGGGLSSVPPLSQSLPRRRRAEGGYWFWSDSTAEGGNDTEVVGGGGGGGEYPYDLSGYSVRFERCQLVKTYEDNLAARNVDHDSDDDEATQEATVLAVKHLVVFRLCPSDQCTSCNSNYGEYAVEVDDYLTNIADQERRWLDVYCSMCDQYCEEGEGCQDECEAYCWLYDSDPEDTGYADASEFVRCQKFVAYYYQTDDEDEEEEELLLYIGPRCTDDGTRIYIDVFLDENCWEPYDLPEGQTVEDIVGYKISYLLLKNSYLGNPEDCLSCRENLYLDGEYSGEAAEAAYGADSGAAQGDADDVNEMCEGIYNVSAKCESMHGLTNGFIQLNRDEGQHENQIQNEEQVCTFIDSLMANSYTERGEINIYDEEAVYSAIMAITARQKAGVAVSALVASVLACYAVYLKGKIRETRPGVDLSAQGDGKMS